MRRFGGGIVQSGQAEAVCAVSDRYECMAATMFDAPVSMLAEGQRPESEVSTLAP